MRREYSGDSFSMYVQLLWHHIKIAEIKVFISCPLLLSRRAIAYARLHTFNRGMEQTNKKKMNKRIVLRR